MTQFKCILLAFGLIAFFVFSSFEGNCQLSDKESKAIETLIDQNIKIEAETIASIHLQSIVNAQFFLVTVTPNYAINSGYREVIIVKTKAGLSELNTVADLIPLLSQDFKLNNEEEGVRLEKVFDVLFTDFTDKDKKVVHKGDQWIFVRKDWFGEKSGFVVSTDTTGSIINIEGSDNIAL